MDARERAWLKSNLHHVEVGVTDEGRPCLTFSDWNVYDSVDDYLEEDCAGIGERSYISTRPEHHDRITFHSPTMTVERLRKLLESI